MATLLSDLIPSLKRQITSPGEEETAFPGVSDETWEGRLADGFWSVKLDGMLEDYTEADGSVTPDLTGDLQQLVVLYAAITAITNGLRTLQTTFRAKAGPVEYETQQAASLLTDLLEELIGRKNLVLKRLSDLGVVDSYYIDALLEQDFNFEYDNFYWPR